jgi:iron complex outermembrane receptor protein
VHAIPFWLTLLLCAGIGQTSSVRIDVRSEGRALAAASVVVNGVTYQTDERGSLVVELPAGTVEIVVVKEGLAPASRSLELRAGEQRTVTIDLEPQAAIEEHVTVAATRTDRGIDDQPMRVELLDRDEIEEKLMMTPGDIVMMLNEMGGLRVQATSPSLGAASVRIQGMRGRYTRFLSDGLPLFGEQVGSFGLLQIPPMDLGQVEVIKGVASSLYGAGAMGGVVNLVSRRPGSTPHRELLFNQSTRGATDAVFWYSAPLSQRWGMTLIASGHGQRRNDVDTDGWTDLAGYGRGVVRPRLFWDNHAGRSLFATVGATWERRGGGTMPGRVLQASDTPYEESLRTRRADIGFVGQMLVAGSYVVTGRASMMHQRQRHQFGEVREDDRHQTAFGEVAVRRAIGRHTWVAGAAIERDLFRPRNVPEFAYTFTTPGVFVQDDFDLTEHVSLSASGRIDRHSAYGTYVSPRVAALVRSGAWSSRLSLGTGFFPPTALTEETEAAGLSRLRIARRLVAERGVSSSLDTTWARDYLSATITLFASTVRDPIDVERTGGFVLSNADTPATNRGIEVFGIWRASPLLVTASYAYVRAFEEDGAVPLTPRHSVGIDGAWERPGAFRIGVEWYYTGVQRLEANPFRRESRAYSVFGVLVERRFGRARLFVNGENLTDVRQTRWDPIVRPSRGADGRWTVDAWAPLDGRNINGGVRVSF